MLSPTAPDENAYQSLVPRLKHTFSAFAHSPEYDIVAGNDDLPGVILAAFARYIIRLCGTATLSEEVGRGVAVINSLYDQGDCFVRTAIRDEFIEAFDGAFSAVRQIHSLLSEELVGEFARILRRCR